MNKAKLRGAMAENGISGNKMSDILGISPRTFSLKLNGKTSFTIEEVGKMLDVLPTVDHDSFFSIFLSSTTQK